MSAKRSNFLREHFKENVESGLGASAKKDRTVKLNPLQPSLANSGQIATRLLERQVLELEQEIMNLESLKNANFATEEQIGLLAADLEHSRELGRQKKQKLALEIKLKSGEWEQAQAKLRKLEAEVADLEDQIEACCERFEQKEEDCQAQEAKLEGLAVRMEELRNENKEAGDAIEDIRRDVKSQTQKNSELKDDVFECENEHKTLLKQKEELQRAIQEIESTVKRVDKEEFEFDSMLLRKTQHESDLDTECEYLLKELEMFRDERDRLELDVNDLSLALKSLKQGGQQMDRAKGQNQLLLDSLREEKIRLITEVETRRNGIRSQKEAIERLEGQMRIATAQAEQLTRKWQESQMEKNQLKREVQRQNEINARVRHLIEGQKYLEGFLEKSLLKNQSMLQEM